MKNIIVGLDIGTTKIACFIGRPGSKPGKAQVIGFGKTESVGVEHGIVINIMQTADSIRKAVRQASEQAGFEVKEVYVGIAGQHIKSMQSQGTTVIPPDHKLITQEDVDKICEEQNRIMMGPGEEIIHIIPQSYIVDNEVLPSEISPVGVAGKCLKANFHIITGNTININNIRLSIEEAGLKVKGVVLEPIASALATLDSRDKNAGVALVDIGGGTTDIAVFCDSNIRHTSVLPMAGNSITEDIRKGCNILKGQAESLKTKFGSCLPSNTSQDEVISIPGIRNQPPREISRKTLAGIIHSRIQLILEQIEYEIQLSNCKDELHAPITLTGGGSKMQDLVPLCEFITGLDCRIGTPDEHLEEVAPDNNSNMRPPKLTEIADPMYATCVGLLLYGLEHTQLEKETVEENNAEVSTPKQEEQHSGNHTATDSNDIFGDLDNIAKNAPQQTEDPLSITVNTPKPTPKPEEKSKGKGKTNDNKSGWGDAVSKYFTKLFMENTDNED